MPVYNGQKWNLVDKLAVGSCLNWNVVDKCLYITVRNGTWLINWPWESV